MFVQPLTLTIPKHYLDACIMHPFHLRCVSVNQGQSVNVGLSQNSSSIFEHKCHIHDSYRSELRQYSVKMGRCRSVCGNSGVDGAMMSVRVAMYWDADMTDMSMWVSVRRTNSQTRSW